VSGPLVLGIETSCDETGAGLVRGQELLADAVASSVAEHARFGGVVPEVASRAHLEAMVPAVDRALATAGVALSEVDAIAVTAGPGLAGALLVGVCAAKAYALALGKPLYGVNHLAAHVAVDQLEHGPLPAPAMALLVSGGHSSLLLVPDLAQEVVPLGATIDDAAGEAFDKVAILLGLGYPGGPAIERLAAAGDPERYRFPRPLVAAGFDFSFSGLKTAVLRAVRASPNLEADRPHLARGFQDAVFDVLLTKLDRALALTGHRAAVLAGGVACSRTLAALAAARFAGRARVIVASPRLNADNAAMIARAGAYRLAQGERSDWSLDVRADLPLPGLERSVPTLGAPS